MNPWIGDSIFIISVIISIIIRAPHEKVSAKTKIAENRMGATEKVLIGLVILSMMVLPILSFTPALSFANYVPSPLEVGLGSAVMVVALWVFYRSHRDLGKNWSPTLQIREGHFLVTEGVYRKVRHPMYTSLFLMGLGQLLLLSNWIAGPATLVAFTLMFLSRLKTEEEMMLDKFGDQYRAYRLQTKRLIPGVW